MINYANKTCGKAVSISYIIKILDYDKKLIYQCIHDLLEKDAITQVYSSTCPNCRKTNISKDEFNKVRCNFCNELYFPHDTDEKFIINNTRMVK